MVMAMAAMHEQMHQGTGEQWQPDEQSQHVGLMFGEQQHPGDHEEAGQDESSAEPQEYPLPHVPVVAGMILH